MHAITFKGRGLTAQCQNRPSVESVIASRLLGPTFCIGNLQGNRQDREKYHYLFSEAGPLIFSPCHVIFFITTSESNLKKRQRLL